MQQPTLDILKTAGNQLESNLPGLIAAYLFGSAAMANMHPGSDIDLAFLSEQMEDPVKTWELAQMLAKSIGRDVDLVDLRRASTVMAAHIVTEGQLLLSANTPKRQAFETYAIADYARLNEERQAILQDIKAHGRIHA